MGRLPKKAAHHLGPLPKKGAHNGAHPSKDAHSLVPGLPHADGSAEDGLASFGRVVGVDGRGSADLETFDNLRRGVEVGHGVTEAARHRGDRVPARGLGLGLGLGFGFGLGSGLGLGLGLGTESQRRHGTA